MRPVKEGASTAGHGRGAGAIARARIGRNNSTRLPEDWRDRLPDPEHYYRARVAKLGKPNGQGWAQGRCPLHEDRHESLSVHLAHPRGGWKCFAGCGKGDLVAFHERMTGLPFREAVADLMGAQA